MARISHLLQDRPDLMFASMQACCAVANPTVRDSERAKSFGRYLTGRPVPVATEWQLGSVLARILGRRPSHSTISVGWSDRERRTLSEGVDEEVPGGVSVHRRERALRCSHSRVRRAGQNLWIQEASKSGRFVTKKVGTNVNPADLMTKPPPEPKIEQLM